MVATKRPLVTPLRQVEAFRRHPLPLQVDEASERAQHQAVDLDSPGRVFRDRVVGAEPYDRVAVASVQRHPEWLRRFGFRHHFFGRAFEVFGEFGISCPDASDGMAEVDAASLGRRVGETGVPELGPAGVGDGFERVDPGAELVRREDQPPGQLDRGLIGSRFADHPFFFLRDDPGRRNEQRREAGPRQQTLDREGDRRGGRDVEREAAFFRGQRRDRTRLQEFFLLERFAFGHAFEFFGGFQKCLLGDVLRGEDRDNRGAFAEVCVDELWARRIRGVELEVVEVEGQVQRVLATPKNRLEGERIERRPLLQGDRERRRRAMPVGVDGYAGRARAGDEGPACQPVRSSDPRTRDRGIRGAELPATVVALPPGVVWTCAQVLPWPRAGAAPPPG